MNRRTLTAALLAAFICLGTGALAACSEDRPDPVDTQTEAVTADESADGTSPESDPAVETPADSEPESETEAEAESETAAETPADSETVAETETQADTEPVTAPPRYDYMEADVSADVTIQKSDYTDMQLTLPAELQITDEAIKDYIEYIRFDYRTPSNGDTQMTDQPMKLGDDAFIYYKGVLDGEEFEGGSNWDDEIPYQLGLGSGSFIPGFEEGLVGIIPANATKDNPAEVNVTFPENYNAELAGKAVVFYIAVEYAVQYDLPTYNRQFVEETLMYEAEKDFYASERAYLEEFEGFIRAYLEEEIAADIENAKLDALWNYLTEKAACQNLPRLEMDFYYASMVDEVEYYYEYYKSYSGAEFTKEYPDLDTFAKAFVGAEEGKDWKDTLTERCEMLVRKDMITHAIAELEGIESVTEEEYKAELAYWVSYYQGYMTEEDILQSMGETYLRESAFSAKMQEWLLAKATFTFATPEA